MVDWHFKRLDALAAISKRAAEDLTLPGSAREMFLRSYHLARTLRQIGLTESQRPLDDAFTAMCEACKDASLHGCAPTDASFDRCRLVAAQMS